MDARGDQAGAVPLARAGDAATFGGKAANLARALGHGLPVPSGVALAWPLVDAVAAGDRRGVGEVKEACSSIGGRLAVRSSAVGEDSGGASFAGRHASVLNVGAEVVDAVVAVWRSAHGEGASAYRRRLGRGPNVRVAVVVQRLVDADVAGVAFTPHPVTGADEVVVEAAWGLGEAVAGGLVVPDRFRLAPSGEVIERRPGNKHVDVRPAAGAGTATGQVAPERARALCLDDDGLARVHGLATRCRQAFGGSQDLEWALAAGDLWLLQRRAVTTVS
ncbi:MAG: hypothetical protein M3N31_06780 [Actinomycetota bacterium]|nr:hypothetical protein [Actinomycetota bacterium]